MARVQPEVHRGDLLATLGEHGLVVLALLRGAADLELQRARTALLLFAGTLLGLLLGALLGLLLLAPEN